MCSTNLKMFIIVTLWCYDVLFLESFALEESNPLSRFKRKASFQERPTNSKSTIQDFLPKIMIFEPDRLFWPFCVETEVVAPFVMRRCKIQTSKSSRKNNLTTTGMFGERELVDRNGTVLNMFSEAPIVIQKLQKKGVTIAVAQTTSEIATMRHLLHVFEQDTFFSYMELDLEPPYFHVEEIKKESAIEMKDLVYFGSNLTVLNELKNKLKILTVHVPPETGLSIKHVYAAIYLYNIRPFIKLVNGKIKFVVSERKTSGDYTNVQVKSKKDYYRPTFAKKSYRGRKSDYTNKYNTNRNYQKKSFTRKYYDKQYTKRTY